MAHPGVKVWGGISLVGLASALAASAITIAAAKADDTVTASELLKRATVEAKGGRLDAAVGDLTAALRINPSSGGIYLFRGSLELHLGRYAAAGADLDQAVAFMPGAVEAWRLRGLVRRQQGALPGAEQDESHALELDPLNLAAFLDRGLVRMERQDFDEALDDFTLVATLGPDAKDLNVYGPRALLYLCQRDWAHAEADLRQACRIGGSGDAPAYWELELWVANQALHGRPAADAELAAARAHPKTPWTAWSGLLADYLLGRTDEQALLAAARAVAGETQRDRNCEAFCYLGYRRLAEGDARGAQESFRRCVNQGVLAFNEHQLARAELRALAVQPPVQVGRITPSNLASSSVAAAVVAPIGLDPK